MCDNCWFYTLSAIPQTLGAIIALTATFVVFKLSYTENRTQIEHGEIKLWLLPLLPEVEIDELTKLDDNAMLLKLRAGIKKLDSKKPDLGFDGFDRLRDLYRDLISSLKRSSPASGERIYNYLVEKERIYSSLIAVRKNAILYLFKSLIAVMIPIVLSFVLLPLRDVIGKPCDIFAVSLVVVLSIGAILYTIHSVRKIAWPQLR